MKHIQKIGNIDSERTVMACVATVHATGPQPPDVPQHPLDGPIPTD